MQLKQSCNDCIKQSTCQKAMHVENYSLGGCSDFIDKNIVPCVEKANNDTFTWEKTAPKIDDVGIWTPKNDYVPKGVTTQYKLVISKEIFIEAYNKWIKGGE